jgi:Zn-dependent protease with chaperone function
MAGHTVARAMNRRLFASFAFLLTSLASLAAQPCGGLQLPATHPQAKLAYELRQRLSSTLDNVPLIVYSSLDINAYTITGPTPYSGGTVCIPQGMVVFFEEAPDELGAIIAHEMGHALDETCRFSPKTPQQQQACENRADQIGFTILTNATQPFSPAAMARAFGRIEAIQQGGTNGGFFARLRNWNGTHPITPDRIAHVRQMIVEWAQQSH